MVNISNRPLVSPAFRKSGAKVKNGPQSETKSPAMLTEQPFRSTVNASRLVTVPRYTTVSPGDANSVENWKLTARLAACEGAAMQIAAATTVRRLRNLVMNGPVLVTVERFANCW